MTGYSDRVNPEFSRSPAIARTEETVLGLLLLDRHFRSKLASADAPVTAEDFYTEFSRRVFEYIRDCLADNESESNQLNERFTPDEIGRITSMKLRRMQLTDNGDTVYAESVAMLKKAVSEKRLSESGNAMALLDDILKQKRNDT
jgi:replicative DNA helicase